MAQIITYPKLSTLADKDLLLVSDVSSKNKTTNSLEVDTLAQYIITTNSVIKGGGTLNRIPLFTPTGAEIGDSIIRQSSGGNEIQVGGDLVVTNSADVLNNLAVDGNFTLNGLGTFNSTTQFFGQATFEDEANFQSTIKDQFSNSGTAGQVLSSTGSNVEWIDNASSGGVGGSGTVNTIAMFTPDGTTIGDSPITKFGFSDIQINGSVTLPQFSYLYWGSNNSDRLSIQNNIAGSDIRQTGSGTLRIQCDSEVSISALGQAGNEALAKFKENGPIELYYDNVKTFETTSGGAQVSGDLAVVDTGSSTNPVVSVRSEQTVGDQFQSAIVSIRTKETSTNIETVGTFKAFGPNSINTGGAGNVIIQNQTSAGGQVVIASRGSGGATYYNRFKTNGQLQLEEYGSGTLAGTAAYNISVDASGNLIETSSLTQTTGNYTPQLIANAPSEWVISSYNLQQGKWIRIGNMVFCDFTITIAAANISGNTGSASGLTIQGWPYDHDGGGGSFQEGTLNQCNGFDVEVKGTNFTLNTGLGNAKLNITKQDPTITTYFSTTSLKAGDFNNGNQVSIIGSFSYLTADTATLNPGATIDP